MSAVCIHELTEMSEVRKVRLRALLQPTPETCERLVELLGDRDEDDLTFQREALIAAISVLHLGIPTEVAQTRMTELLGLCVAVNGERLRKLLNGAL